MEDFNLFSRREFIKSVSALGAASLTLWTGGCESCITQIETEIKNRPTRRNIQNLWNANPSDPIIATYKLAVQKMKALTSSNPTDPRGWESQAQIHNNSCIHRNWLWLPWHRAYLVYFERICRKLSGDDTFALPYWNWNAHPAIPDPFWDTSSPLYDPNRVANQTSQAGAGYIGTTILNKILGETNFELFASAKPLPGQNLHFPINAEPTEGDLESTPHDSIHNFVGGDMGQFISPRDPVFYTHHCMIDCLWTHWNIDMSNPNTNDPSWTNFSLTDFFDENGNSVTLNVITTVLFPILTYQYEPCTIGLQGAPQRKLQGRQLKRFLETGAPSKLDFVQRFELRKDITAEVGKAAKVPIKVEPAAFKDALQDNARNRVVLTIADVEIPDKRDFFVRVFLNKPDASAQTSVDDLHYAGSFGFFFDEESVKKHAGFHGEANAWVRPKLGYLVDITRTLQMLNQAGSLPSEISVSFVPTSYTERESTGHLTLHRLEVALARF